MNIKDLSAKEAERIRRESSAETIESEIADALAAMYKMGLEDGELRYRSAFSKKYGRDQE